MIEAIGQLGMANKKIFRIMKMLGNDSLQRDTVPWVPREWGEKL
ncbi:hypothetical protein SAMN05444672_11347 [Bacillus sp. OK838]|nr:hypothetical protein SAMN05444672_11347 [Bacillus sp. OK838]